MVIFSLITFKRRFSSARHERMDALFDIGYSAGKKIKGRKRHILVDTLGMLLQAEVHSAGIQDRDGAAFVFDKLANRFPFIEKICGDGGYQGPTVEEASPRPMEIVKRNQAGIQVLPKRWIVERTLAAVWRRVSRASRPQASPSSKPTTPCSHPL
ncbi:transposase [Rhizobium leguminosarum]|nr:transposase [Rhizobium leguminosarum]